MTTGIGLNTTGSKNADCSGIGLNATGAKNMNCIGIDSSVNRYGSILTNAATPRRSDKSNNRSVTLEQESAFRLL